MPPQPQANETGTVTLIAMRARPDGVESGSIPETPRWLEAIRRQLSPRMPLGSRLVVTGPRYAEFTIEVRAEPEQGRDPVAVKSAIVSELRRRLALVRDRPGMPQRAFGLAVTRRDLSARLQALADVRRVSSLKSWLEAGAWTKWRYRSAVCRASISRTAPLTWSVPPREAGHESKAAACVSICQ